ncbi:SPOR domain-containing protein [Desulfurobacterium sp.]
MKKTLKVFLIITLSILFSFNFPAGANAKETPVYTIQLANTHSKSEAEKIFSQIRNLEYSRIDKVKKRYKVRIGLFKTRKEAQKYLKNHPEIKKVSPTAYITLNYYDPKRTIEKGFFPSTKKIPDKTKTKIQTTTSAGTSANKTGKRRETGQSPTGKPEKAKKSSFPQSHLKINYPAVKKYAFWIAMIAGGILAAVGSVVLVRKLNIEEGLCCMGDRIQNAYVNALKCIPLKTSKKILEYHYKKIGDFRSLILMKLQDQDFTFILRETPKYLLKHPDDILVWKIYIEVLAQLGIYSEAATACEKLAEILRKNSRPEAAENYLKKAEEYRNRAAKPIENAG